MKIGVVGSGNIGSTVGRLLAEAGHNILFSSRHPEELRSLAASAGNQAQAVSIERACREGDVLLVAIPFKGLKEFGRTYVPAFAGKVILETSNPYPERDGTEAQETLDSGRGTGVFVRDWLHHGRIVRAFNSIWDRTLAKEAHRKPPRVGIPLASDDLEAMDVAAGLVRDAGFDPVPVGALAQAVLFDVGTAVYNVALSASRLQMALGIKPHSGTATELP